MRPVKLIIAILGISIASFISAHRVYAATDQNSVCNAGGGCIFPCAHGTSGSSQIIPASQLPQCSPQCYSTCSSNNGNANGVCGVFYSYSSWNCDPTTITNSYYIYQYYCSP